MNKYIRKCLIVYTSLALILVGMAGAAYAITATDADNYVTRSQYAVDMAHLQNKLDEQEAGLMGNINRYRSTNVKFVTFDTPNRYYNATTYNGGLHNGGNPVLRPKPTGASAGYTCIGVYENAGNERKMSGSLCDYSIYRLWNGNYYITKNLYNNNNQSSPTRVYQTVNYAVPIENFPGWYLEVRQYYGTTNGQDNMLAIIKLDPTSATADPATSDELVVRFKKDLFRYVGAGVTPLSTTPTTTNHNCYLYRNTGARAPMGNVHQNNASSSGTATATFRSWLDSETGDYMMTLKGLNRCYATSESTFYNDTYYVSNNTITSCKIMPNDNVEYVMGGGMGTGYYSVTGSGASSYTMPVAAFIGTGFGYDPYWQYEIVDGVNGIKYFHAYRAPASTKIGSQNPIPYGIHYSLPIVY